MSVGHAAARGWAILSDSGKVAPFGAASLGLATALVAVGASAQQAPSQQLPPIVVEGQAKAPPAAARKKSASAPKAAPKRQRTVAPPAPSQTQISGPVQPAIQQPGTFSTTPSSGNTLESGTGIARLPGTVQDTPQVVNVVPQEQIRQQNATSVDQVLRNVPGITVAIGEGGGGFNGDQFRVRGFEAKGDIYVDGLRDFGVYVRDSFATEDVSVLKGPSSESFGSGTTGGVISLRQKSAHLGDAGSVEASIGSGMMYRTVVDINKQVSETSAVRAVGMYHNQDIVDRDHVYSNRWGFLGSIALGLKTDTTWVVNYMHQTFDRMPDYGVPMVARNGATRGGLPVTELGVDRSTFYGRSMDHDEGTADILTSRFQTKLNSQVTFHNDTRFAFYQRDFSTTVPGCSNADPGGCADQFLDGGNPIITYGGGNPTYKQDVWGIQNVSSMVAKFHTGRLRHEAVAGVDVFYQEDDRPGWSVSGKTANATIRNPEERFRDTFTIGPNPVNYRYGDGSEIGLFASDRVWLLPQFSVLAGVRWSSFESAFHQPNAAPPVHRESSSDYTSPKVSLIWEPTRQQTYYASWATAATPVGQFVTNSLNPIGSDAQENLLEEHESWEIGAKYSLFNGQLGLTAAAFEVTKDNAAATDPATGLTVLTGEVQRVRGIELGIAGSITPAWKVNAGYAYLDSEILESATASNVGNRIGGVPEHNASLWTSYNLSKYLIHGPGEWLVGAGVRYQSFMYASNNSANLYGIPSSTTFDAMVSYELDGWKAAVNGYNLTDELYYDASFNNRAIPAAGRAIVLTISKKF
ncbi:MAG: TonB-dependent receptor [Hyphomicrobiaceae bacterium]